MKKTLVLVALLAGLASAAFAQNKKALLIYDEDNKESAPYRAALASELREVGFYCEVTSVAKLSTQDLAHCDLVVIYSIVMAFASKSPLRDWLKSGPDLAGRKVAILVTANRWKLSDLYKQQLDLLAKRRADVVDSVSAATKNLTQADKDALIRDFAKSINARL